MIIAKVIIFCISIAIVLSGLIGLSGEGEQDGFLLFMVILFGLIAYLSNPF